MDETVLVLKEIDILNRILIKKARNSFKHFVAYTMPDYFFGWHHKILCEKLQAFQEKKIRRLMIFMPPRHGKSQLGSRHFPAYCFGKNPNARIIATSYSSDLASDMNIDTQKIINSIRYRDVFPRTSMSSKSVVTVSTLPRRNSTMFEIVGHNGVYRSAGVGGPITGKGADYILIDDPIKNNKEAESKVYRDAIWKWYTSTLYTRLEEKGSVLLIMTRWHEDDLAGRLLKASENPEADQWEVLRLPAIREDLSNPVDPRDIGQALWPEKYDLTDLKKIKAVIGSRYWTSLYQNIPSPMEGNVIKREWFKTYSRKEILFNRPPDFYIDSSYTDKTSNDPSAILAYYPKGKNLYLSHSMSKHLTFPQFIKFLPLYLEANGYTNRSRVYIEPKASGISIYQEIRDKTNINIIKDRPPVEAKLTRVFSATPVMETNKVFVPEDESWVDQFLTELAQFPNGTFDDQVDCLTGAIRKGLNFKGIRMV